MTDLQRTAAKWVYERLSDSAELAAYVTGVYNGFAPTGDISNVVIFTVATSTDKMVAGARRVGSYHSVAVKVSGVDASTDDLYDAYEIVDSLLHLDDAVLFDGVKVMCYRTGQFEYDEITDDVRYSNIGGDYEIHLSL